MIDKSGSSGGKMRKLGRPLAVAAMAGSLFVLAALPGATPGSAVSATVLATGTDPDSLRIRTDGPTDTVVRQITIQPGGTTGWHYHDGHLIAVVISGKLVDVDKHCHPITYSQGQSFIEETGADRVHMGENEGNIPVVLMVTYLDPAGSPLSVSAPAPKCANG